MRVLPSYDVWRAYCRDPPPPPPPPLFGPPKIQVLGEERKGAPVLIVACPSADILPSLVSNSAWDRFYVREESDPNGNTESGEGGGEGDGKRFDAAPCVVHLAPAEVLRTQEYGEWARRFGRDATHIVTSQPFCSPHSVFQVHAPT